MLRSDQVNKVLKSNTDFKSKLLEWCQQEKRKLKFTTEADDNLLFTSELKIDGKLVAKGLAKNKKQAEQQASKKAFELIIDQA